VSAFILSLASLYFCDLPWDPGEAFLLDVTEPDLTIEFLLQLLYPVSDPMPGDLADSVDAFAAAQKYQLDAAASSPRKMLLLPCFVEREAVRVYSIARWFRLDDEVDVAAHGVQSVPAEWPFCEEFEQMSALLYHELLMFHKRQGAAAAQVLLGVELCRPCSECGKQWTKKYRRRTARMLLERPTSGVPFSNEYVAMLAKELDCTE
jgi:hypothetical protein